MALSGVLPPVPGESVSLASLLTILGRRKKLLLWPVILSLLVAAISCAFGTRRYRATAEVQVQKEESGAFGLDTTVLGQNGSQGAGDSLDYTLTLQTEVGILRSPALARTVLEDAHLEPTAAYFPASAPGMSWWSLLSESMVRLGWAAPLEPLTTPLAQAPNRRYVAEKIFAHQLKVQPIAGTRLIDVSYTDPDPVRAAAVANTITRVLADMTFQQRFTAMLQGSSWLAGQLDELRARTEQAQARAAALERGTGLFGSDASRNIVLERLDSLNQTLTAAESNRILKESIDKVAASGSPELISSLSGNSSTGSVASMNTSLTLIQGLRQQEAAVRADLAQNTVRYGPAYPKVAELEAQLAGITTSINQETARLGRRAHTDWEIAVGQEAAARTAFERQKELASKQNDSVIAYGLARREADSSRELYEGLLSKLKQASLLGGLRSNNVSVVSAAEVPPSNHPASPNIPLRLGAGCAAGLFVGAGLITFAEMTDSSIHSLFELEAMLGVPLLGILPAIEPFRPRPLKRSEVQHQLAANHGSALQTPPLRRNPVPLPVLDEQPSIFGESLRSLRTALSQPRGGAVPRVILVTSCLTSEGKTTVAFNLAALLAQDGSRVLLVDADMRRPTLHYYGPRSTPEGFAMALSGRRSVPPLQPVATMPNLELLAGSEVPPFPSELLGSARMPELLHEWKSAYDFVVIDSPPVLPVTDAVLLARHSDVTLLVARHQRTTKQALRRTIESLQQQGDSRAPVGVVLNDVARDSGEFYQYFGYEGGIYANEVA